jgi:hypothetical protein
MLNKKEKFCLLLENRRYLFVFETKLNRLSLVKTLKMLRLPAGYPI